MLPPPTLAFTIPSVHDGTVLDCRIYHPPCLNYAPVSRGSGRSSVDALSSGDVSSGVSAEGSGFTGGHGLRVLSGQDGQDGQDGMHDKHGKWRKRAVVMAHPYAPLGGSYDDAVVGVVGERLLGEGWIVGVFNFRGAAGSKGRTSWTSKPEQGDYTSFAGFLACYLHFLEIPGPTSTAGSAPSWLRPPSDIRNSDETFELMHNLSPVPSEALPPPHTSTAPLASTDSLSKYHSFSLRSPKLRASKTSKNPDFSPLSPNTTSSSLSPRSTQASQHPLIHTISHNTDSDTPPTNQKPILLLAGYSYGSLITISLPPLPVLLAPFSHPDPASPKNPGSSSTHHYHTTIRARALALASQQSHMLAASYQAHLSYITPIPSTPPTATHNRGRSLHLSSGGSDSPSQLSISTSEHETPHPNPHHIGMHSPGLHSSTSIRFGGLDEDPRRSGEVHRGRASMEFFREGVGEMKRRLSVELPRSLSRSRNSVNGNGSGNGKEGKRGSLVRRVSGRGKREIKEEGRSSESLGTSVQTEGRGGGEIGGVDSTSKPEGEEERDKMGTDEVDKANNDKPASGKSLTDPDTAAALDLDFVEAYLLISPLQGVVGHLATMSILPWGSSSVHTTHSHRSSRRASRHSHQAHGSVHSVFEKSEATGHDSKGRRGSEEVKEGKDAKLMRCPTLALYGTEDAFSSRKKLRAWAERLGREVSAGKAQAGSETSRSTTEIYSSVSDVSSNSVGSLGNALGIGRQENFGGMDGNCVSADMGTKEGIRSWGNRWDCGEQESRFRFVEVEGAGHFWHERGAVGALRRGVTGFVRELCQE